MVEKVEFAAILEYFKHFQQFIQNMHFHNNLDISLS